MKHHFKVHILAHLQIFSIDDDFKPHLSRKQSLLYLHLRWLVKKCPGRLSSGRNTVKLILL